MIADTQLLLLQLSTLAMSLCSIKLALYACIHTAFLGEWFVQAHQDLGNTWFANLVLQCTFYTRQLMAQSYNTSSLWYIFFLLL